MAKAKKMAKMKRHQPAGRQKALVSARGLKPSGVSRREYRDYLRGIRRRFEFLPVSGAVREALAIKEKGADLPVKEGRDFLSRHKGAAARAMIAGKKEGLAAKSGIRLQGYERTLRNRLNEMDPKAVAGWVEIAANYIIRQELRQLRRGKIKERMSKYFKARKIPVRTKAEKDAFEMALGEFFQKHRLTDIRGAIDLAELERTYFFLRGIYKGGDLQVAQYQNTFYRNFFGRKRLTANQRRTAKRWIRKNWDWIVERQRASLREIWNAHPGGLTPECIKDADRRYLEIEAEFRERAREEVLESFREREPAREVVVKKTREPEKKLGTRTERMAAYQRGEKTRTELTTEIQQQTRQAELRGEKFDPVDYALKQIEAKHKRTASAFRTMLKKRQLDRGSLVGLFTSGNLTQRLFMRIARNPEFQRRFGEQAIKPLARGLSYIGPTGRQIVKVRKLFEREGGGRLFSFLMRRKYFLEAHHAGGDVVYLARNLK